MAERKQVRIGLKDYDVAFDDAYGQNLGRVFEPGLTTILSALQPRGTVALDVGANIGLTSLLLSQQASRVHAFEVVPSTFNILRENIAHAELLETVELHPFGLGDAAADVPMRFAPLYRSGAFVDTAGVASADLAREVGRIETLDSVPIAGRIGIIKLDVEGYEALVLAGGRERLAKDCPIVVLELNHWCLNAFRRTSVPDFLDELRTIFPVLLAVDEDDFDIKDLHSADQNYSVLHEHIVRFRYKTIVAAFDHQQTLGLIGDLANRRAAQVALAERDDAVAAGAARIAALEHTLSAAQVALAERDDAVAAGAARIAALEHSLSAAQVALAERDDAVAAGAARVAIAEQSLRAVLNSRSWRYTQPLRRLLGMRGTRAR
jgi:FkbM family methyltransferase